MRTLLLTFFIVFVAFFGHLPLLLAEGSGKEKQRAEPQEKAEQEKAPKKAQKDSDKMTLEDEERRDEMLKRIEEPRLSNKWFRGNYLIYDCDKGFYACVNRASFTECTDQRTIRIEERRPALGCAPLKRFDSQKECFKVQYEKMHNQVPKIFCVHPNFR